MSHHKALTISKCDIVTLKSKKKIREREIKLFVREEAVELGIDLLGDALEVCDAGLELQIVAIDDDEFPRITLYPFLVTIVQTAEVVDADALFVVAATLGNLCAEVGDGAADVYHQVGQSDERQHEIEELAVVVEVAVAHVALGMEVRSKDACVLEDGAVLDDGVLTLGDLHDVAKALVEEIDLEVEAPAVHVLIEVVKIWVCFYWLETRRPAVTLDEQLGEGGLAAPNVSSNGNMHNNEE